MALLESVLVRSVFTYLFFYKILEHNEAHRLQKVNASLDLKDHVDQMPMNSYW